MKLNEIENISLDISAHPLLNEKLPLLFRLAFKVRQLVHRTFLSTLNPEEQFKVTIAQLLSQKNIRSYFLEDAKRRQNFLEAVRKAAIESGYAKFSMPLSTNVWQISLELTLLEGESLLDHPQKLSSLTASMDLKRQQSILCTIFEDLERPAITSTLKVEGMNRKEFIPIITHYAQYKMTHWDEKGGALQYTFQSNHATSSMRTQQNVLPDQKGTINQHYVLNHEGVWIGSYCGELTTPFHVLEQIFLILGHTHGEAILSEQAPIDSKIREISILFTSLYSWNEFSLISEQREAIRRWDQRFLISQGCAYHLDLLHYNIPFGRFPTPAEIKATMHDMNEESWIILTASFFRKLGIELKPLAELADRVHRLRRLDESQFIEREKALLKEIDTFRQLLPQMINHLNTLEPTPFVNALRLLYDKKVGGIDRLLSLDYAVKTIDYVHNKNSRNGMDRCAAADASDKAQHAFQFLKRKPYLPGLHSFDEKGLFKQLYALYLLQEEPQINVAYSTAFQAPLHKNHEMKHYL